MKIAIPSKSKTKESEIYTRSGRAPYFLIFQNGEFIKALENPYAQGEQRGVGPRVAKLLLEEGVEKVIAQEIGPNMKLFLEDNGVKVEITDRVKVLKVIE